ncbi:MAG: ATP-binding protein [Prevotellaceae bacterium]|nr:ATP-binding protein [Prevotellaceae bacterium]
MSLLIACSDQRATGVSKDNDSTHTTAYINKISLQEPERALAIIDTMEINKEAKPYEINYLRLMVYVNGSADKKLAEYYGKQVLKDSLELQKNPKEHISILNNLANIAYSNSQFTQGLKYAKTSVEVARKNHLELQEVVATHYMGLSALALGDTISGLKLLKEGMERIIRLVDGNNTLYDISQAYMLVCNYMVGLLTAQRYDEAEKLIPDLLFITKKAKEVGKTIDGMAELRQIYTSSLLLEYYDLTGNTKEGEKYLAEIQKSKLAGTSSVEHIVANHYFNVKDVENLAQVTARLRESTVATGDTLTDLFLTNVLSFEKYICRERGNYREALEKAEAIISVKDSLAKRKNEQDGLQLAKIYDTQEKEKQIAEQKAELAKHKNILIAVVVLLVIGVAFIVIVMRFNRRVNRRNKTIVATINQMMQKEDKLTRMQLTDDSNADNVNPEEIRLKQSLEMLKEDKPTDEIVTQCGYRDAADFNKKFYGHFGIHADEYRKWSKKINEQEQAGDDEAKQMKDSFIKNMSHEIRTPLNQIFGFVQLLTDPNFQLSDEQKRRYNEIIGEQTNFMTRMLNKFLELSEYESSDEPLPKETVAIDDLFNEVNSIVPRPAEGVELTFHNNSGLAEVETNHKGLSRIIQCLVGNAVKFTAEGYISVECATNADGNTIFTVTDTGKGIPEGEEEKIFDRFYKVDDFVPGAGLGLPLVRVIARRMGATVELDRTYEAKGSRFRVSLRA